MSNTTTGSMFASTIKTLLLAALKLCALIFSWGLRLAGLLFSKLGELIEKMLIKRS